MTTTWQRFSFTSTIPSIAGKTVGAGSYLGARITGMQIGTFQIANIQVEAGSVATPFSRATGTLQGELAACQRYYQRIGGSNGGGGTYQQIMLLSWETTTAAWGPFRLAAPMRAIPTMFRSGNFANNSGSGSTLLIDSAQSGPSILGLGWNAGGGGTPGYCTFYRINNDINAYIEFSAEL